MRVLVVGNGGREHALTLALHRSPSTNAIFATRPNAGMGLIAEALNIAPTDVKAIVDAADDLSIDLVVVGPEAPLVAGLVDRLDDVGIPALGPSAAAAQIEGSKQFAKEIMAEAGIPTAAYGMFDDADQAIAFVREHGRGMVVKADGLAAGKGVIVCDTVEDTEAAIHQTLGNQAFGQAGETILIEERLEGPEVSVIALVDGETVLPFPAARDHKRIFENDEGPNTGGMGAFSPVPEVDDSLMTVALQKVLRPAARTLARRGTPFRGFLYAGLMLTPHGMKVLEFNCRMGDPECQPLLARLQNDVGALFLAAATGQLASETLAIDDQAAVCVVLTSGGYPGAYSKGLPIQGLDSAEALEHVTVIHAGTKLQEQQVVTNGGRVLGITALGPDLQAATQQAYLAAACIHFDGMHLRLDIASSALRSSS
jgi:phosphoribosylamine--glycine ligase